MEPKRSSLITIEECPLDLAISLENSSRGLVGTEVRLLWTEDKLEMTKWQKCV